MALRAGTTSRLFATLALASMLALAPAAAESAEAAKRAKGGKIHRGNYTCYQGGLTSEGSLYWGYFKVKRGYKYEISGSSGKVKRKGKKLIFTGTLKRWDWKGRYRTSRTGAGKKQWHIDLIDKPNDIRVQCHDGG